MLKVTSLAHKICAWRQTSIALPLLIAGCVADIFGQRAVDYNTEADLNKDKAILTNIVRASLGRPLQFTELTTVSGTASASLSLAGTFPFAVHRPPSVGQFDTFSPTISLSGGPTFSVANLSTKEFYSGMLAPLEMQIIAYYLEQGYPPQRLLPLVISNITYGPKNIRKNNDARSFDPFYSALNGLLALNLTTEKLSEPIAESPVLSEKDAKDPKLLASLASGAAVGNATLDLKRYDVPSDLAHAKDPNLSSTEYKQLKATNQSIYFRLEKQSVKYRFCVDAAEANITLPHLIYMDWQPNPDPNSHGELVPVSGSEVYIPEESQCGAKSQGDNTQPDISLKGLENFKLQPRSVMEIIAFLGDIVKFGKVIKLFETTLAREPTITLFTASEQVPSGSTISATVDAKTYYVEVDPYGNNMSSRVLELVAELIALHSSAKDLPAPNVITVISP
jgi:hypothetical protein